MSATAHVSILRSDFHPQGLNMAIEKLVEGSRHSDYDELDRTFVGQSPAMLEVKRHILSLGKSDLTVLISGESGTGKDLVARAMHRFSSRAQKPFIKVNTPGLPDTLFESELFGFEQGAFTGALKKKPGRFQLANRGTIFLDEIGELPLPMQAKLLQVLEDKEYSPLGSVRNTRIDVRALAATNTNLNQMVSDGKFRLDLYYRLNVASIHIPPLREHKEDVDLLCEHFLQKHACRYGKENAHLPEKVREQFHEYSWPGNVRELENAIRCVCAVGNTEIFDGTMPKGPNKPALKAIRSDKAPIDRMSEPCGNHSLKEVGKKAVRKAEMHAILGALGCTDWNRKKAAAMLKTSYRTLLSRMKEYQIRKSSYRSTDRYTGDCSFDLLRS